MGEAKPLASLSSGLLARKGAARPAMRRQGLGGTHAIPHEDLGWNDMGYDVDPGVGDESDHHDKPMLSPMGAGKDEQHVPSAPPASDTDHDDAQGLHADEDNVARISHSPLSIKPSKPAVVLQREALAGRVGQAGNDRDDDATDGQDDGESDGHDARGFASLIAPRSDKVAAPEQARDAIPPAAEQTVEQPVAPAPVADQRVAAEPVEIAAGVRRSSPPRSRSQAKPQVVKARGKAAFTLRIDPERHLRLRLASALTNCSAQQILTDAFDAYLKTLPQVEALAGNVAGEPK